MRLVVALGGNALLRRGEPPEWGIQSRNVEAAMPHLATLARQHQLVATHGNGPQVGLLALQAEAYADVDPHPLDVLGAESQGMIGYALAQALENELARRPVGALLTQTIVDRDDPAFAHPTKPIGPTYTEDQARRLAAERDWSIAPDGPFYRRVVASPEPKAIVELEPIRRLFDADVLVVCAGGGGIPVVIADGRLRGVEAVIDKDLAASLLATTLDVDMLVILTDVPAVERDWGSPDAQPIVRATPSELRALSFAPGSMGPKVEAACRFVERTGRTAAIGAMEQAEAVVACDAGTHVVPDVAQTVHAQDDASGVEHGRNRVTRRASSGPSSWHERTPSTERRGC
jgi:carbamate kinase